MTKRLWRVGKPSTRQVRHQSGSTFIQCPCCSKLVHPHLINSHIDEGCRMEPSVPAPPLPLQWSPQFSIGFNEALPHASVHIKLPPTIVGHPVSHPVMCLTINEGECRQHLAQGLWTKIDAVDFFMEAFQPVRMQLGLVNISSACRKVTSFNARCTVYGPAHDLEVTVQSADGTAFKLIVRCMAGTITDLATCRTEPWRNTGHALRDRAGGWKVMAVGVLPVAVTDAFSAPSVASISRAQPSQQLLDI
jgi:hypothetical protein